MSIWIRKKNANSPFHCRTVFPPLDSSLPLQRMCLLVCSDVWKRVSWSSGGRHHRITGREGTRFLATGGCAICSVSSQQTGEERHFSIPEQSSGCGDAFCTALKLGSPGVSVCLGVSGFDGTGGEGVYGKELPHSSQAIRAPLQKVSEVSPTPLSNARNQLAMTSFS